jgi:membrane protein implicated in regulation of membrane protease activity
MIAAMLWWHWLAGGLLLLVLELVTAGFFIMFFGLGAITVGVLMRAGVIAAAPEQWLLFTVASLAYLGLFRRRMMARLQQPPVRDVESLVGDVALPQQRIEAGGIGRAEVRGTMWTARNEAAIAIEPGQRCRVVRVTDLEVGVQPEKTSG